MDNFHKHKEMADGHLNECKDCTRIRNYKRLQFLRTNQEYVEKERKRGRDNYHLNRKGKCNGKAGVKEKWNKRYPEKLSAANRSRHLEKPFIEAVRHHWSYNEEHQKSVIWLTNKEHNKAHRFLVYDYERKMYRRCDTMELLETIERHEEFIRFCIENKED